MGTSIADLLRNLDGDDYCNINNFGLMDDIEIVENKIHEEFGYNEFIAEQDLYSDFHNFIECLLSRIIGEYNIESNGLFNEFALIAIASVRLDPIEFNVYKKY